MADASPTINASLFKRVLGVNYDFKNNSGKTVTKQLKFNNINQSAALADLYAIGSEIATMTALTVTGVETIDTSRLLKA